MLGLGGYHLGRIRDDGQSVRLIRKAIDMGVTFLDNAWEYHNGRSEELMGKALADGYRKKVFLMTKHHGRDKKTAMKHLEDSLRRLRTDVIDLWQFHEVVCEKDPEMIFAVDGGIEAADLARKQGKVRFIGFTGHRDPGGDGLWKPSAASLRSAATKNSVSKPYRNYCNDRRLH